MAINAHRAFFCTTAEDTYLGGLTVDEEQRDTLRGARDEIRETIRRGFRDWAAILDRQELFESVALATTYLHDAEPTLRPKFRMQGSWSYFTLNRTTIEPPQQIDADDGVFLPVSFLTQNGTTHPAIVSGAYFAAVEKMLAPLCEKRGWTLITDKSSCVRVQINSGTHVDLALYAIPDADFRVLVEKAQVSAGRYGLRFDDSLISFDEDVYPSNTSDLLQIAAGADPLGAELIERARSAANLPTSGYRCQMADKRAET